ncbi:Ubiquitin and WLM domain-containing metalloprotease [Gracilariopsis chorda]|uniref:Ubiquitin and WLM domain-containing metalloprotease n=1 Tax=Gracilariopsis chorda TaxID=448386 RepID=A0A2V3IL17_9FLOR|nr:Ubiquitin and WLM domain-containing metalloprotease [Gracilariopsis chorda]|eukprot:PXF41830.1 Ubiquitin and WLM domain-containing metalloprotease [Gracilariopsis chorda]
MKVTVSHRGRKHVIDGLQPDTTLQLVREQTATLLDQPPENVRLLHKATHIRDWQHTLSSLQQPLLFMALVSDASKSIKAPAFTLPSAKPSRTIPSASSSSSRIHKQYVSHVQVFEQLPNSKTAYDMLQQLANDSGFAYCVHQKNWHVGTLKEMLPDGRVGVDPVCVLGYNRGKGHEIALRLRTDDMQGFRDMKKIREVFAHELAHCERSEHDEQFKEIMRWVERNANARSWNVGGHRLNASHYPSYEGTSGGNSSSAETAQRLGGHAGSSRLLQEYEQRKRQQQARHNKNKDNK